MRTNVEAAKQAASATERRLKSHSALKRTRKSGFRPSWRAQSGGWYTRSRMNFGRYSKTAMVSSAPKGTVTQLWMKWGTNQHQRGKKSRKR